MINTITSIKTCSRCNKKYPATAKYFYRDQRWKTGLKSECKLCSNKAVSRWGKHNPECLKIINQKVTAKWRRTIRGHLWSIFDAMLQRCNNPKCSGYKNYGGRNIKIKFKNHEEFISYCIDKLQIDPRGLEIDRINNDGHYKKGNIRFVTHKENNNNRRKRNA